MQFLDPASVNLDIWGIWFIFLIGVTLPVSVVRSSRRQSPPAGRQRIRQRLNNVALLLVLFAIALAVARQDGIRLFPPIPVTPKLVAMCAAVFAAILSIAELVSASRTLEERKRLWVRQVIPRTPAERAAWMLSSAVAGVTEETIFRGVFFVLVASLTKSIVASAVISALAFSIGHYRQGRKSMLLIAMFALVFQWLIIMTGSLVPAMLLHALYNMTRGLIAGRRLERHLVSA